jgi:hypothetical protein
MHQLNWPHQIFLTSFLGKQLNHALLPEILNHPLNITRVRFGFQNSLSVHNITWLGQGTFTYEKPSYLKKNNNNDIFWKTQQRSTDMSVTTNYSFNNIIINTMTNFVSPSPAQLLRTTPSSPQRSHYQTKNIPQRKDQSNRNTTYRISLDLRGGGLTRTKYYVTGQHLT